MRTQLVVIGIDGADPLITRRLMADNRLPHLARVAARGTLTTVRSTTPPTTLAAWTSFFCGAPPQWHGVTDFTVREGYAVRFIQGGRRRLPTWMEHVESQGLTVGMAWFPATYPPLPLRGYHIAGWDSPVTRRGDDSFVAPRRLHEELARRFADHLRFDPVSEFDDGPNWYQRARDALVRAVYAKRDMACWLLQHHPTDVAAFYFGETDTVAHHFLGFWDEGGPRWRPGLSQALTQAVPDVYAAVDDAVGDILACAPDARVLLLSDHGSAVNAARCVHLNRILAHLGLLRFRPAPPMPRLNTAVRAVPAGWRRRLFRMAGGLLPSWFESRRRFGGIDWDHTKVFSEDIPYAPSLWFNQRGREPRGTVTLRERRSLFGHVRDALLDLCWDDGSPLFADIRLRDDHVDGPFAHLLPDIQLTLAPVGGYTPVCAPASGPGPLWEKIPPSQRWGRKGAFLPGGHAPMGIAATDAPIQFPQDVALWDLGDVLYELLDIWPPEPYNRRVDSGAAPVWQNDERAVARRLRDLGYLDE